MKMTEMKNLAKIIRPGAISAGVPPYDSSITQPAPKQAASIINENTLQDKIF